MFSLTPGSALRTYSCCSVGAYMEWQRSNRVEYMKNKEPFPLYLLSLQFQEIGISKALRCGQGLTFLRVAGSS